MISLKRIKNFLLLDEIDTEQISHDIDNKHAVHFDKANFSWEKNCQESILKK